MSLLWKMERGAEGGVSYLFGTMHVRDQRAFGQFDLVSEKIMACEGYAAEFHLEASVGEFGDNANTMFLKDGETLSELLGPRKFAKYRRILLKSTGVDLENFERTTPFLVLNLVHEAMLKKDMPGHLDQYLWDLAKAHDKSMHGIETLGEQLRVLSAIPQEAQLKMLSALCANIGKFRSYLFRLTAAYEAGDLRRLYQTVKNNSKGLRELMLYRRNKVMAERIDELAKTRSIFIAIGAAHLPGGKGVLRLLKKRGWRLTPVLG